MGYELKGSEAELAYMVLPDHWGLAAWATPLVRRIVAHIFETTEATAVIARAMPTTRPQKQRFANPVCDGSGKRLLSFR
jgi:hypothetical protein